MDKTWIMKPRNTIEYEQGVRVFIDFALSHSSVEGLILCPCSPCGFRKWHEKDVVFDHLLCTKFPEGYNFWYFHGETEIAESSNVDPNVQHAAQDRTVHEDPIRTMLNDAFGVDGNHEALNVGEDGNPTHNPHEEGFEAKEFYELAKDGEQPLYEGCKKYSKLSFIVKLYHIKCLCGMSDKAMTLILELLHDAFEQAKIPTSFYEAKKTITKLGLDYQKIHACRNNCMLYWGVEDENKQICKVCYTSRWKPRTKGGEVSDGNSKRNVPAKVVHYFPLKPRLQRLFLSSKTAEDMKWHAMDGDHDGKMRHPRDSEAWKKFDSLHTSFASDARNVRLGLATDGFNPFGNMSSSYSIWPVVLIPYNTPPWLCMKSTSFIISTIIPGKRAPGNDIDVYLQPLMKELQELWLDGVDTYDASAREMFKLHAALLWTISDFPGLGNLSGWNTYTGLACPSCNFDFETCRLHHSKKWCFMGHRRFLHQRHRFRLNKVRFNGKQDMRNPPTLLSGCEILEQVQNLHVTFGRTPEVNGRGKRARVSDRGAHGNTMQWKKKSIFFELPYWRHNLLRHNLDLMHIEKNVCDNIIFTLLNDANKSKDHMNARKDLQRMGCKHDLWPFENGKYPLAVYTMTNQGKKAFLKTLRNITVPDGYASNISRCIDVDSMRLSGMLKSHDCHILMEQLLPLATRISLPDNVLSILIELCSFFKQLSDKVLTVSNLDNLQRQVVLTLCHMEMLFPPSFFTVMVHLVVHLVEEAKLGGPVHYRWMYPIERYLGQLKSYVRNRAQPEGSIAQGYLIQEILTFCSRYLDNIETMWNRLRRVDDVPDDIFPKSRVDELFPNVGKPIGASTYFNLTSMEWLQAHRHVLTNCPLVESYVQEFRTDLKRQLRRSNRSQAEIDRRVHREFVEWFSKRVVIDMDNIGESEKAIMFSLAKGPFYQARRFNAYNVNGTKYRTLEREKNLKTQNSGVYGTFDTRSYSSSKDGQMICGGVPYYGKLIDIIEINYNGLFTVALFKCQWADTTTQRGLKKDKLGFTQVNFSKLIHTGEKEDDEPYIKASEAQMVFYVDDEKETGWSIPVNVKPRDLYDMGEHIMTCTDQFPPQNLDQILVDDTLPLHLSRPAIDDDVPNLIPNQNEEEEMDI
ncbi:uncharacterized protein LOC133292947 [Gastrolobium bilobum]|uniref:uncharacterized protein LOC133292947 n=1 Tax=Gastrolobium bilobum TaxID=150636 RepID=UPI002AB26BA7|nr:uncharacterized protein LOC133292947 [Gastrolobium bilobum]